MKNVKTQSVFRIPTTLPPISTHLLAGAAALAVLLPATVRADTDIYGYQFTGFTFNPTTVSSGLSGSAFAYVNTNPSLPPFTNPPVIVSGGILPDDPPNFVSQGDWFPTADGYNENYYQFSVSVTPGYTMNVNSFSFSANSRQSVPFLVQIQYSTSSSFTSPVSFDASPIAIPTQEVWNTFTASDAPIVQGTGTYYFRIYAQLDPNGNGTISDLLNTANFALNGSIQPPVVPPNLYWDPGKIGAPGSGGPGTWLASNSWADGNTDYTWSASLLGVANFGGASGGAVALGGSVSAPDGLNFTTGGYNITGTGSQLLTAGGTISTTANATISAPMTTLGNATLIKSGTAFLTIAGPADFAAGTSLSVTAGTLAVSTSGAIVANGAPQVVAEAPGDIATLTLQGTGSFSTDNSLILADLGGNATLNVSDTATLAAASLIIGQGQTASAGIGTVNQSGGTVSVPSISLATGDASSIGIYNLNGGTLVASSVTGGSGNSTFVFNGGTVQLSADAPALFSGIGALQIQSGGATLDTHGHNATLAASLSVPTGSTGTFSKTGLGTLTLSLPNAFPGPIVVNGGTLLTDNYTLPSSSISIAAGAVLEYNLADRVFQAPTTYTGNGTLRSIGTGQLVFGGIGLINVDFAAGALVDVEAGTLFGSSSYDGNWTNNFASVNVAAGAIFNAVEAGTTATMQIDALTGAGTFLGGYVGNPAATSTITLGIAGGSGSFSGSLGDDAGGHLAIVKAGNGTETFSGNNTYTGATSVHAGTLVFASATALPLNNTLSISAGATTVLTNNGIGLAATFKLGTLTLDNATTPAATLDLTTSKLIVETTIITKPAVLATLQSQANYGKSHSTGILSINLPAHTSIAVVDNAALSTPFTVFGGLPVDINSILIAPELLGDSNLDGKVDLTDLNAVLNHLGTTNPAWTSGNFDGAPTIDLTDLNDVLNNLGTSIANPSAAAPTPEPASFSLLLTLFPALLNRRLRRPACAKN